MRSAIATTRSVTWATRLALLAIAGIALLLAVWKIDREGTSNLYYAAAIRSMLQDPVAFLFGGFDSGRYITLDKPPLGFQLQAASAAVLGFNGFALLLPQIVATVLSVWFVYLLVRPSWGAVAGLVAALALALTPVSVAVARNTTVDATLVAVLLAGALALQRGLRTGRGRWLALAFALVGLGFEIKMLQAYLVLPAFTAAWLVTGRGTVSRRAAQLGLAAVPLVVVSFAWPAAVALWPAGDRPWIGGSTSNSLFDLAFGYNGLDRLSGRAWGDIGTAGLLRFLEPVLVSQVGWMLPLAALGCVLGFLAVRRRGGELEVHEPGADAAGLDRDDDLARLRLGSIVLWTVWLVTCLGFFSVAQFWHRHYLVSMAPAVAAPAGIAVALGWRAFAAHRPTSWLLPIALVATGALAAVTIVSATDLGWMAEPVLVADFLLAEAIALVLAVRRLAAARARAGRRPGGARTETIALRLGAALSVLAIVAALVPPTAWSIWTVTTKKPVDPTLPTGGPAIAYAVPGPIDGGGGGGGDGRAFDPTPNPAMLRYLVSHRGDATWILAVGSGLEASPMIVETGLPVMAIGGFDGRDPATSVDAFRSLVRQGRIRFASAGIKYGDGPVVNPTASDVVLDWVAATCTKVPEFETLYDCAGRG